MKNKYFTINQFLELGRDPTSEKSLEIINYFAKFDNGREAEPTIRMEAMPTANIYPAYIMGKINE